jgi:hypothetical protein
MASSPPTTTTLDWPPLRYAEWEQTCDTLHLWTQIVGKTRLALTPLVNHWWNVPLYVTPRGLATSAIPYHGRSFDIEFDLVDHLLRLRTNDGSVGVIALFPRSVADFYAEYRACLRSQGIEVSIWPRPVEFDDPTPFDEDRHHAAYDVPQVESFHRILVAADGALGRFRSRFLGKCSPVHFFWGSFDLAVSRFSGRRAPERPGVDRITHEAYSHEVSSCGFWPGDRRFPHAAFYAYTAPTPDGLGDAAVGPPPARWEPGLAEFVLRYEDVRGLPSPDAAILEFCQSSYEAGATLAGWNRVALERDLGT